MDRGLGMEKRVRRGYRGNRYPSLGDGLDRRGFLARLGAASGLVALGGLNLAGRSIRLPIYAVDGGNFLVMLPTDGSLRAVQLIDEDREQYYRVNVLVDVEGLAVCLEQREANLLPDLDAVVREYPMHGRDDEATIREAEDAILEVLKSHCVDEDGDDDTTGDDDATGDDDSATGDDDSAAGDDDSAAGDDDSAAGDDDSADGRGSQESDDGYVDVELFVDLDPYADDYGGSGGCSCSSVPWRARRRR